VIATGRTPNVVARVAGVSRQALYRPISRRPAGAGPGRGRPGDEVIVEVAKANPTDGTRMVAALTSRQSGTPVNRKRVQRVMREHKLLQHNRNTDRRGRPGFFRATRPDELWHLDMTKVWTASHRWVYLHVAVDCCTREVACWRVDLRTRSEEAIACIEQRLLNWAVPAGRLTLGSDSGGQFTSRDFRKHLSALASPTATAVTAIPNPRRSSNPGSDSSGNAAPGAQSGKPPSRQGRRAPTTPGSATASQKRSPPPGGPTPTTKIYKP
jgi:putative transposase